MHPFDREEERQDLLYRLNDIPRVSLPENGINRRPSIQLASLSNQVCLSTFLHIIDRAV